MFGLSWDQIILVVLAALFLLGPERIPTAMKWGMDGLRKLRTFAAGAQTEMRSQLGPELDELRRQVAELQSLKELKELRELRELDPRRMIGKSILGDEFSGGVKGFLGLTGDGPDSAAAAAPAAPASQSAPAAPVTSPPSASGPPVESLASGSSSQAPSAAQQEPVQAAPPQQEAAPLPDVTPAPARPTSLSSWGDIT